MKEGLEARGGTSESPGKKEKKGEEGRLSNYIYYTHFTSSFYSFPCSPLSRNPPCFSRACMTPRGKRERSPVGAAAVHLLQGEDQARLRVGAPVVAAIDHLSTANPYLNGGQNESEA